MPFPIVPYRWEASAAQPVSLLQRRLTEPYPAHGHDYFELELVVSGSGRQWLNGEALSMEPGCLYLLSPADFHRLEPNASLDVFSFHFTPEYAAQLGFSLVQEARHTQISSEETAQFAARLSPLAKPSAATDLFYQQELLILLLPLLLRLLRQGEAMHCASRSGVFRRGSNMCRLIIPTPSFVWRTQPGLAVCPPAISVRCFPKQWAAVSRIT